MKRYLSALIIAVAIALSATPAAAQNHTCPTPAPGDNSNKCASTAFVQGALSQGLPLTNLFVFVGNSSNIATGVALSGDCVITNLGVISCIGTSTNGQLLANSSGTTGGVGIGTALVVSGGNLNVQTGTSGATVPLNNGNNTFSGTVNFSGTFEVAGNAMTFPGTAAALASLGLGQTFTGTNTFSGIANLNGGGALAGTFTGNPTFSGNLTFSGDPLFTGLASGTCSSGLAINASNSVIKAACPGAASSIQIGSTTVTTASGTNRLLTEGTVSTGTGTLADTPVTADSSGNLAAVNSLAGTVIATKAQQQAATSTTNVVTPSQQQSHPSAAKAWLMFTGGSTTIDASYNVTSITNPSTGSYAITFTTAFATVNYACSYSAASSSTAGTGGVFSSQGTGSIVLTTFTPSTGASSNPSSAGFVECFGGQ